MESELQYHPSAEQRALADTIEESLSDLLPLSRIHRSSEEDDETWAKLLEIGIFAIGVGEADGGSGLGASEEALIGIALGRHLASPTVLATIGSTHAPTSPGRTRGSGARISSAFRRGDRVVVVNGAMAEGALIRSATGAEFMDSALTAGRLIDGSLWLDELYEASASDAPPLSFDAAGVMRLRLLDAANLAGMAHAALDMSVAYALTREQFGRPIGSFQAVKHHCANMAIAARCARDQTAFAAVAIDQGRDTAAMEVESALFVAGSAALDNAGKNIQIHGGLGFSDEANPHLLLKRAQLFMTVAGGLEAANERLASPNAGM